MDAKVARTLDRQIAAQRRIRAKLAKGPLYAVQFSGVERGQLRALEVEGAIVYRDDRWHLAEQCAKCGRVLDDEHECRGGCSQPTEGGDRP